MYKLSYHKCIKLSPFWGFIVYFMSQLVITLMAMLAIQVLEPHNCDKHMTHYYAIAQLQRYCIPILISLQPSTTWHRFIMHK